mgnify:CR=1 FL=1
MKAIELTSVVIGVALLLAAGCTRHVERVVLLPSADGSPAGVAFNARGEKNKVALSQPYEVLDIGFDSVNSGTTTEAEVRRRYGKIVPDLPPPPPRPSRQQQSKQKIVAAQPPLPQQYLLYFVHGKTDLTRESQAVFESVKDHIAATPTATFVVVGHTDRVGSQQRNDALSLRRAQFVRARLIAEGMPKDRIEAVGRGEREPLIQTADEVAEPRNRRVEIRVR